MRNFMSVLDLKPSLNSTICRNNNCGYRGSDPTSNSHTIILLELLLDAT